MDPSLMKKLLEDDEDESMHSGADVDAFQAALNRDIGGDLNHPSLPSVSDSAMMSQGSHSTSSQSMTHFEGAPQDEHANYQAQREPAPREMNSPKKDPVSHTPIVENTPPQQQQQQQQLQQQQQQQQQQHDNSSQPARDLALPHIQSQGDLQNRPPEQNPPQYSQPTGSQNAGKVPVTSQEPDKTHNPDSESQFMKLQKMSNQQATVSEQPSAPATRGKQVPFGLLLPVLMNQLDKDKGMQLQELFAKLKKEELTKEAFVRLIRGLVGEQVLRLAVIAVQTQLQSQGSARKSATGVPSGGSGATQFTDPRSIPPSQQRGATTSTDVPQNSSSKVQGPPVPGHQIMEKKVQMLREVDRPSDPHGMQAMYAPYGGNVGNSHMYSGVNVNNPTLPIKSHQHPHPHDSQMRQMPQHQSIGAGGETHGSNIAGMKVERQISNNDPSRIHGGSLGHFSSNQGIQQRSVPWQPPPNRDQSTGQLQSSSYVKPEPVDQTSELQNKIPLSSSHGPPSVSAAQMEQGSMVSGTSREESFERRPPAMGFPTSTPPPNPVSSSMPMQVDSTNSSGPRVTPGASMAGNSSKTPPKKPPVGQKKPLETLGSSPPPASKKQKVSGNFLDQSIEQLNDVTAVSGVNLREEEEQLFSVPKEDSRASEASRKAVQEEEERLILQKNPLQKKLAEIMTKCGLKCVSNDVERCLSLAVEERMRGLIDNLIRVSKQRVDVEKSRHQIITTSDIRHQIMTMNQKAKEEWEKKQAEAEKLRKQNEPEMNNGDDGEKEKDEGRNKSVKMPANKEEDDKMRTTAANVAARAAVGGDDMLSKWQLMAEQARQKREGGTDSASGSQLGKDLNRKSSTPGRTAKDHQDTDKRGGGKKTGRNQAMVPQTKAARSISVKDIIAVLEREPQMSKSTLVYRLYDKIRSDVTVE